MPHWNEPMTRVPLLSAFVVWRFYGGLSRFQCFPLLRALALSHNLFGFLESPILRQATDAAECPVFCFHPKQGPSVELRPKIGTLRRGRILKPGAGRELG